MPPHVAGKSDVWAWRAETVFFFSQPPPAPAHRRPCILPTEPPGPRTLRPPRSLGLGSGSRSLSREVRRRQSRGPGPPRGFPRAAHRLLHKPRAPRRQRPHLRSPKNHSAPRFRLATGNSRPVLPRAFSPCGCEVENDDLRACFADNLPEARGSARPAPAPTPSEQRRGVGRVAAASVGVTLFPVTAAGVASLEPAASPAQRYLQGVCSAAASVPFHAPPGCPLHRGCLTRGRPGLELRACVSFQPVVPNPRQPASSVVSLPCLLEASVSAKGPSVRTAGRSVESAGASWRAGVGSLHLGHGHDLLRPLWPVSLAAGRRMGGNLAARLCSAPTWVNGGPGGPFVSLPSHRREWT